MRWVKFVVCLATLGFFEGISLADPPTAAAPSSVKLHIDSPKPVAIEHRASADAPWAFLCNSPCDIAAPPADEYRVAGAGISPSAPFELDSRGSTVATIRVNPGNLAKTRAGYLLLAGGVTLLTAGAIVTALGFASNPFNGTDTNDAHTSLLAAGAGLLFAGLGTGIYGGALVLDNRASRVSGPGARRLELVPTGARAQIAPRPSFVFPILSASF